MFNGPFNLLQGEKPKSAEADSAVVAPTPTTAVPTETSPSISPTSATTSADQPRPAGQDVNTNPYMPGAMPSFPSPIGVNPIPPFFPQFSWNLAFNANVSQAATSPALMMPRFPYPPSHYSTYSFYPPGCSLPPGVGMLPCPYPEQRTQAARNVFSFAHQNQIPVNISANSISSLTPSTSPVVQQGNLQPSDPQPDVVARPSNLPSKSAVSNASSSSDETTVNKQHPTTDSDDKNQPCACPPNSLLLKELLHTVKRVGSDEQVEENVTVSPENLKQLSVPKSDLTQNTETQDIQTAGQGATALPVSEIENTASVSLHRKDSLSGRADSTDGDQNSEADVPPLETSEAEQRSFFEKSTSSSMSDIDKKRKKAPKGLRQRQSAPGQIQAEGEDVQNSETSELHRIEASSGDTQLPRGNHHQGARVVNLVRAQARGVVPVVQRHSHYDASFIVMLGLSITTAIILLNRLLQFVDWSELFPNSVWE